MKMEKYLGMCVGMRLSWGWLGCEGRKRGDANMLFGRAFSLFH